MVRFFKHHLPAGAVLELVADGLLCFAAILLAVERLPGEMAALHLRSMSAPNIVLSAALFAAFMALLYAFAGLYRQGAISVSLGALASRGIGATLAGSCVAYLLLRSRGGDDVAPLLLAYAVPVMAVGVVAVRSAGYVMRRSAMGSRRILIVGAGPEARTVATDVASVHSKRHTVVGFVPTTAEVAPVDSGGAYYAPIFDRSLSIEDLVRTHRVDEIIVAVHEQRGGGVPMHELLACRIRGVPVIDLAGFFERTKGEVRTDSLKASWLIYGHGFVQDGLRTMIKRDFDLAMSLLLLAFAWPVMVLAAIAIKLDSRGPIFYRQERVGLHGRTFVCLKFRSMSVDAEKDGVARWSTKNDARVTRVGAFIRKCRIDELPQLLTVLRGEMSLVGPRPERPSFVQTLRAGIPFYDIRHSVKPGITGWAQVRYGYGASVEDARRKHQFDLYYVKNHRLFLDLLVLIETVSVVLFREGAQ